jgi:regulator of protease activity HflC (stomatin/prohibitin superfamily)
MIIIDLWIDITKEKKMNVTVVLSAIVTFLWIAVVALIILAVVRASRGRNTRPFIIGAIIMGVTALVLTIISAGLVFVQPEERAVVISAVDPKGYRSEALQPGLNWIVPFFENVVRYPISNQTYTMSIAQFEGAIQGDDSITARTSDGQEVFIDASVLYALDPNRVVDVHIQWQDRYTDDLVRPLARGIIRDAVSQYGVQSVYSLARDEMTQEIRENMAQKLEENGLNLVDFVLRNITFSPEYAASVEQKQIAEQLAQQAKFTVEQRKQEAEQARQVAQGQADAVVINAQGQADARLIQAEAESKALELIASALQQNQELLTYTYINKIAPGIQVMLLPSNSPLLFPLPEMTPSNSGSFDSFVLPSPTPVTPVTPTTP